MNHTGSDRRPDDVANPLGGRTIDFEFSPDDLAWQEEVREFLAEHLTDAVRQEKLAKQPTGRGPAEDKFWGKVAERGWFTLTWPRDQGGEELDAVRRLILTDEFAYAGAPVWDMTYTSLAPVLIERGTEVNKEMWLPRIRSGEVRFALGYSEPGAGTDLAALRTSATLDGDEWVITGEKIWNTGGHEHSHEWLAVRTGPGHAHHGISIIIVPIDSPGVEVSPIWTWGDHRTNTVRFDEVRVPACNLVGEQGRGWTYIVEALDNERGGLGVVGGLRRLVDDLIAEASQAEVNGEPLSSDPVVRLQLAELYAEVEAARLLSFAAACSGERPGTFATVPATMLKVLVTELRTRVTSVGLSIFGLRGQATASSTDSPMDGWLDHEYREAPMWRFGGGANEVMRDVIAQRGYGLPRGDRRRGIQGSEQ